MGKDSEEADEFKKTYFKAHEHELNKIKLLNEIDDMNTEIQLLKAVVKKSEALTIKYPIVLGITKYRIHVTNAGDFKTAKKVFLLKNEKDNNVVKMLLDPTLTERSKTNYFYFANNFISKRKITMDDKKVNVTCRIRGFVPTIVAEHKKEWKGETFWADFVREVDIVDESTWMDFFGILSEKYTDIVEEQKSIL